MSSGEAPEEDNRGKISSPANCLQHMHAAIWLSACFMASPLRTAYYLTYSYRWWSKVDANSAFTSHKSPERCILHLSILPDSRWPAEPLHAGTVEQKRGFGGFLNQVRLFPTWSITPIDTHPCKQLQPPLESSEA